MPEIDPKVFEGACQGDRDAFWQMLLPHRGLIYSVANGMLKDHEKAQDALQEVLLIAFRSVSKLRDPQKLPSWLYSITRNHINGEMRKERRLRLATQHSPEQVARVVPVSEVLEKEAWLVSMESSMQDLPEPFRVILGMKYTSSYSCCEIAEILNTSVSAVKSRLFEARKMLRKLMEKSVALEEKSVSREEAK